MYGISNIKAIIERYDRQCREERGRSPLQMVDYRIKSAQSIAEKLEKKGYEISSVNAERYLSDLAGVRVVCFSEKDVYALERFLHECDEIAIVRRKDYIKLPKANGYRSLHLIAEMDCPQQNRRGDEKIRVELQLRTREMHQWAEMDHRRFYKKLTK